MTDTLSILDANAVISIGAIADYSNYPSAMDVFFSPEWSVGITSTVHGEINPRHGNQIALGWIEAGLLDGSIRSFSTFDFPPGDDGGELSIISVIQQYSTMDFIVVTDDRKAKNKINSLNLDNVQVRSLQEFVESSLVTGGVTYADYANIALHMGWAPLGFPGARNMLTNGVTIELTEDGLVITDVFGVVHFVSAHEKFTITEDGRFVGPGCFTASTPVTVTLTETRPISDIRVGDTVLAFDPAADLGRGALVPRKVVRLYRNTTDEWVKLTWAEGSEAKELIATPGHHFLDSFGSFPTIEEMLENGRATVVLTSGELTEVTAERIIYSAETTHLFEQAQAAGVMSGNAALKPVSIDAWQTYNFEVEDLHTYVAGGVRVHNDSGLLGMVGNAIDGFFDGLLGGEDRDGTVRDKITDFLTAPLHWAGEVLSLTAKLAATTALTGVALLATGVSVLTSTVTGLAGFISNMAEGNFGKAIESALSPLSALAQGVNGLFTAIGLPGSTRQPTDKDLTRTSWTDTDGRPHWGSETEKDKAKADGTFGRDKNSSTDGSGKDKGKGHSIADNKPILLDLDGDGVELTDLSRSTMQVDSAGDGLLHRTAWAGAGDGVLFIDADGNGVLSNSHEYVFTEWAGGAADDLDALRKVFDSNGDGKLTSADARWGEFRVLVSQADGSKVTRTLAELGITEINLTADAVTVVAVNSSVRVLRLDSVAREFVTSRWCRPLRQKKRETARGTVRFAVKLAEHKKPVNLG